MSSVQSRTLPITYDNVATYWTAGSGMDFQASPYGVQCCMSVAGKTSYCYATVNNAGKNVLFPNATAHPVKLDFKGYIGNDLSIGSHTNYGAFFVSGTQLAAGSYSGSMGMVPYSTTGNTNAVVTGAIKSTEIKIGMKTSGSLYHARFNDSGDSYVTLYFNRYDFSASAGTGVVSSSVSSSTGYDGDSITFSCILESGAIFDGWYNGSTKVSDSQTYVHTVSGSDLALTAKAIQTVVTKSLSVAYNGSQLQGFPVSVTDASSIVYNGVTTTVPFDGTAKTMRCGGKVMAVNAVIGGKTLLCANMLMAADIVVKIT